MKGRINAHRQGLNRRVCVCVCACGNWVDSRYLLMSNFASVEIKKRIGRFTRFRSRFQRSRLGELVDHQQMLVMPYESP